MQKEQLFGIQVYATVNNLQGKSFEEVINSLKANAHHICPEEEPTLDNAAINWFAVGVFRHHDFEESFGAELDSYFESVYSDVAYHWEF